MKLHFKKSLMQLNKKKLSPGGKNDGINQSTLTIGLIVMHCH